MGRYKEAPVANGRGLLQEQPVELHLPISIAHDVGGSQAPSAGYPYSTKRAGRSEVNYWMIPNERLYDDSIFIPNDQPRPAPNSLGQLFAELHLSTADETSRRDGLHQWLRRNQPSASLQRSIRRRGYGDVLD